MPPEVKREREREREGKDLQQSEQRQSVSEELWLVVGRSWIENERSYDRNVRVD
jgi:hypothetical protein